MEDSINITRKVSEFLVLNRLYNHPCVSLFVIVCVFSFSKFSRNPLLRPSWRQVLLRCTNNWPGVHWTQSIQCCSAESQPQQWNIGLFDPKNLYEGTVLLLNFYKKETIFSSICNRMCQLFFFKYRGKKHFQIWLIKCNTICRKCKQVMAFLLKIHFVHSNIFLTMWECETYTMICGNFQKRVTWLHWKEVSLNLKHMANFHWYMYILKFTFQIE